MDNRVELRLALWKRKDRLRAEVIRLNASLHLLTTYEDKLAGALSRHACQELRALLVSTKEQIHEHQEQLRRYIAEWEQVDAEVHVLTTSENWEAALNDARCGKLLPDHPASA